jgi:tripartite-type tricarboxylate transporter receptor subunit TctC
MLCARQRTREIVTRLNAAIAKIVNMPDLKEAYMKQGLDPATNTPEEFGVFIHNGAQNIKLAKAAGIKIE